MVDEEAKNYGIWRIVPGDLRCREDLHIYLNSQGTCLCGQRSYGTGDRLSTGWICPACGRGNAPHIAQCCCPGKLASGSSTGFDPKTTL